MIPAISIMMVHSTCVVMFVWMMVTDVTAVINITDGASMGCTIAALQPQPAIVPRQGQVVHQAKCSCGTLLHLVMLPEDASMTSSQVNIFLTMQNTRARTNVFAGGTWVRV